MRALSRRKSHLERASIAIAQLPLSEEGVTGRGAAFPLEGGDCNWSPLRKE